MWRYLFETLLQRRIEILPAHRYCETLYDDLLGPSGIAGKMFVTWIMRRK